MKSDSRPRKTKEKTSEEFDRFKTLAQKVVTAPKKAQDRQPQPSPKKRS